jgi:DNA transposition AAA+ family ATPase
MSYASHSHPEAAERSPAPSLPVSKSPAPAARLIAAELLTELDAMKRQLCLTNKQLGTRVGFSESQVGRAFAGKFAGDVARFETNAREFLRREEEARQRPAVKLQKSGFVVEPMADFLNAVQAAGDIGVAYSAAGRGKTCGTLAWVEANPLAVLVTACKQLSGWRVLRDAIIDALPYSTRPRKRENKAQFIQRIFANSGRLLIVDNAHLLTASARYWLAYDWHGNTGCPVALIGNECIVNQWGHREAREDANDQLSSRVGIAQEIRPAAESTARMNALASMELLFPQATGDEEAIGLGEAIIKTKGHGRALQKHLNLARVLSEERRLQPAEAIRAANKMLLGERLKPAA